MVKLVAATVKLSLLAEVSFLFAFAGLTSTGKETSAMG